MVGFPVMPDGHEQEALWSFGIQLAVGLQGESYWQGFTQARFSHALVWEHSKSEEHPISTGRAKSKHFFSYLSLSPCFHTFD